MTSCLVYWNLICFYAGCEIEPPVINGIVIPPKFNKIGSILRYRCVKGHEPTGTPELLCMPNGEWALPSFDCIICKYIKHAHLYLITTRFVYQLKASDYLTPSVASATVHSKIVFLKWLLIHCFCCPYWVGCVCLLQV